MTCGWREQAGRHVTAAIPIRDFNGLSCAVLQNKIRDMRQVSVTSDYPAVVGSC